MSHSSTDHEQANIPFFVTVKERTQYCGRDQNQKKMTEGHRDHFLLIQIPFS